LAGTNQIHTAVAAFLFIPWHQIKFEIAMIKRFMLGLAVVGLLFSCRDEKKERALQTQVDSLKTELHESEETAQTLQEVGVLIDSIDASRQLLRTDMVEGTSYKDYKSRLQDITAYVRETQSKIAELEKSAKNSRVFAGTIKRLKADLEMRTQQIAALEQEVQNVRNENHALTRTVSERDSLISVSNETIKVKEENLTALESRIQEMNVESKNSQADAYFAQAQALEKAAARTKFAPKKKKETKREALELYKMALSLGKTEAESKIQKLEKESS
jgi:DNA repair exonuclease SbcCD ATPase subunit